MLLQLTTCSYLLPSVPLCIYLVQQKRQPAQDLTHVTVDHSQPQPRSVPNENLDVQYTGVKSDIEAPAV